ncbi:MAG: hypothetical protein HQ510_10155 [Candidatus Marinimicrobia bacterium]|nr:hypothetical protein [Candidatus Neomarinimicrobiota bacterium]
MNRIRFYKSLQFIFILTLLFPKAMDPLEKEYKEILTIGEKRRAYYQLHRNNLTYEITGPQTLEINCRRAVPEKEVKPWKFGYQLILDEQSAVTINHERENSHGVVSSQHPGHGYTKSGKHVVKIPAGSHILQLKPDKSTSPPLLVRMVTIKESRSGQTSTLLTPEGEHILQLIQVNEKSFRYIELQQGNDILFSVDSPGELNVISRLAFDDRMTGEEPYRIRIWENNQVIGTYYFSTERSEESMVESNKKLVPGKWRSCLVDTKEGTNVYKLELLDKDRMVYIRGLLYK